MRNTRKELALVRHQIEALPAVQREVLLLVCVEDLSYRQTAELLDVPVATVIRHLLRARQRIIEAA